MSEKKELYDAIDQDEELSDEEKREIYFAELDNQEAREQWEEANQ